MPAISTTATVVIRKNKKVVVPAYPAEGSSIGNIMLNAGVLHGHLNDHLGLIEVQVTNVQERITHFW